MQTVYAQYYNSDIGPLLLLAIQRIGSEDFEGALESLNSIVLSKDHLILEQNIQNGLILAQHLIHIVQSKILSYFNMTKAI